MSDQVPGLLSEHPRLVYPTLANMLRSADKALILQQLHFLLSITEKVDNKYNFVNNKWWVYNSYEEWQKEFPWLSVSTISRMFRWLEYAGLIESMQSVKHKSDRRKWYTIDYNEYKSAYEEWGKLDPLRQIDFMVHRVKLARSKRPKWRNGLSDNTTETTTEKKDSAASRCDDGGELPDDELEVAFDEITCALCGDEIDNIIASKYISIGSHAKMCPVCTAKYSSVWGAISDKAKCVVCGEEKYYMPRDNIRSEIHNVKAVNNVMICSSCQHWLTFECEGYPQMRHGYQRVTGKPALGMVACSDCGAVICDNEHVSDYWINADGKVLSAGCIGKLDRQTKTAAEIIMQLCHYCGKPSVGDNQCECDSTICGYRDPDGEKLTCVDCYGFGVCHTAKKPQPKTAVADLEAMAAYHHASDPVTPTMREIDAAIYGTRDNPVKVDYCHCGNQWRIRHGDKCAECLKPISPDELTDGDEENEWTDIVGKLAEKMDGKDFDETLHHYFHEDVEGGTECLRCGKRYTEDNMEGDLCYFCHEKNNEEVATLQLPKPKAKKERKPTEHTIMIDALLDAMGFSKDDVTCWGEYQSASKKLRKANVTPDEIPALYAFCRSLEKGNYKFKSPMQLAKDLPEYRKHQRKAETVIPMKVFKVEGLD